ncbi:DUF1385 domain-containing protein [uncultured Thermanaerothrix sp.]|uniref:DUF1385 domain-containing protein n=1 Tax=uncultured Thermanaerothrix sp. TaxID=1195149 RepID=UPI00260FDA9B|nr:DUF1385 domain-containing protein [uncultured Thermanaerothrix sp.]
MGRPLKLPTYGGQALIEGVLMRGRRAVAAAMRNPQGDIIIQSEPLKGLYLTGLTGIPFLRGLVILWDALGLGTRYLSLSANLQASEESEKIEGPAWVLALVVSLVMAVSLFFLLPALVGKGLQAWLGFSGLATNLLEGLLRLLAVIGYIWGIGRIPEIQRVFAYHGAEHKTINAYEAGAELTPESVNSYPLEHPRCGTSFILTLVVLSVLIFSVLGDLPWIWLILSRILLIPLLAMLAYEYIRWVADHLDNPLVSQLIRPNLWLQKLTTRSPSPDMLEVSIAAFNAMLSLESSLASDPLKRQVSEPPIGVAADAHQSQ